MYVYAIDWNAITGQCSDLLQITARTIDTLKLIVDKQILDKHAPKKQVSRNKQRLSQNLGYQKGSLNLLKLNILCTKLIFYLATHPKFLNLKNIQID